MSKELLGKVLKIFKLVFSKLKIKNCFVMSEKRSQSLSLKNTFILFYIKMSQNISLFLVRRYILLSFNFYLANQL